MECNCDKNEMKSNFWIDYCLKIRPQKIEIETLSR